MAPRKEKTEKASADQGANLILNYLRKQKLVEAFRITPSLGRTCFLIAHNMTAVRIRYVYALAPTYLDVSKEPPLTTRESLIDEEKGKIHLEIDMDTANAAKTLKEMHERNEIAGRPAGKQTVYHALQDPNDVASPEQLATMDQEIEAMREEIAAAKSNERLLKANLATLNTTLSTEDLQGAVIALELEKEQTLARLLLLRSGSAKPVSSKEKKDVDEAWTQWQRQWTVRKKIAMDVWAHATEVVPEGTTKEELWDSLGLELDP